MGFYGHQIIKSVGIKYIQTQKCTDISTHYFRILHTENLRQKMYLYMHIYIYKPTNTHTLHIYCTPSLH